ncbi:hypothetical protein BJ912DRAFT_935018 [Pholiota molesta]|nr:hypothetical protein BJ912DRAFT_935018 [Pholiota molesta]
MIYAPIKKRVAITPQTQANLTINVVGYQRQRRLLKSITNLCQASPPIAAMLVAIPKVLYAPFLFRTSAVKHAATVKRLLGSKRAFSTTTSVAEEAESAKGNHFQNAKEHEESKLTQDKTAEEPRAPKIDLETPRDPKQNPWQDFYAQYVLKHKEPGMNITQYASDAAVIWKAMSAEEKAACIQLKYGDPVEEVKEYKKYKKMSKENRLTMRKPGKARITLPKLSARDVAMRAENLFIRENYDRNSPLPILERGAELSKRWNELGEEKREAYKKRVLEMYAATGL